MNVYGPLYRRVVFPAWHAISGDGAVAAIRELAARDSLDRAQLKEIERRKLEALLAHAGDHVPYWQRLLAERGLNAVTAARPENFGLLPVLSKDIIRERLADLVSRKLDGNRLDANSTSGSTGEPLEYFTDIRSKMYRKAAVQRNRRWIGIRQGDPVVHLWGSPIDQARAESLRGRIHSWLSRERFLSAYALSDADLNSHARAMRQIRPRLLVGYPSVLTEFGGYCVRRGYTFPGLAAIICSAEALYEPDRVVIRETLGAPVYNRYGCREVGDVAQEAAGREGLIVNSDRVLVEVAGHDGRPLAAGETGELLVTDLDNYGMPLIRYRIGDLGRWAPDPEPTFPWPVLAAVEGRSLDVVRSPTGERIGGTFWTILFRKRPGIRQFQVVQSSLERLRVKYVRDPAVAQIDEAWFRARIGERCGGQLQIEFEEVPRIEPEASGKYRIVRSELPR